MRPITGLWVFQYIPGSVGHVLGLRTHRLVAVSHLKNLGMSWYKV